MNYLKNIRCLLISVFLIILIISPGVQAVRMVAVDNSFNFDAFIQTLDSVEDREINVLDGKLEKLSEQDFEIIGYTNFPQRYPLKKDKKKFEDKKVYYVSAGDTLYKIAKNNDTNIEKIKELNKLKTDILYVGQKLYIPIEPEESSVYIVQPGDSLYLIAQKYNVTVETLKEENNLSSNVLDVGQKLHIPEEDNGLEDDDTKEEETKEEIYTVQAGDSLYIIAGKYNVTVEDIKIENELDSDILYIGQELVIPISDNNEEDSSDNKGEDDEAKEDNNLKQYYVQPGDSLYKIAKKFYTTVNIIRDLNNLSSDILYVGQKLEVPMPETNENYDIILDYVVEHPWETLDSLGEEYGVSPLVLKNYNNLNDDQLQTGQQLSIPLDIADEDMNGGISYTHEELELLARAVFSEARGESFKGQVAVAAVILNRVRHSVFPDTIEEVIFQPWQFTAVHDGQFWLEPEQHAYLAAKAALRGWDPTKEAIYYYNPKTSTSDWVFYRNVVIKIGDHYFAV